jgi:hypothetical protein
MKKEINMNTFIFVLISIIAVYIGLGYLIGMVLNNSGIGNAKASAGEMFKFAATWVKIFF